MKTKTAKDAIAARRARHHAALETLRDARCTLSGLALWRKLRRIETEAHAAATAQCNGKPYAGQPFREEPEWEAFCSKIAERVRAVFGRLPDGFTFNTDPRGHALKIRGPEAGRPGAFIPEGMEKDWGGNGILAAEID